jgi:ATP synthase protein I
VENRFVGRRVGDVKMAGITPDSNGSEQRRAEEADLSARLRGLGDKLGRHRPREPSEPHRSQPPTSASGYALGFRLSSELVAGVLAGAGIGWVLDRLLGISPWGLIIFLLLGFVAGVVNVVRTAGVGPGSGSGHPPDS